MSTRRPHRRKTPADPCGVEGCAKTAEAHDLCHGHYQRWQRHGDVQADRPIGRQGAPSGQDLVDKLGWAIELLLEYWPRLIDIDELNGHSGVG